MCVCVCVCVCVSVDLWLIQSSNARQNESCQSRVQLACLVNPLRFLG